MAAIDGQFDRPAAVESGDQNVVVGGPLKGFEDLSFTLHVVVVDKNGVVAEGEGKIDEDPAIPLKDRPKWTSTAAVKDGRKLAEGEAIGYAAAFSAGPEGIKSWQWHGVLELKADA